MRQFIEKGKFYIYLIKGNIAKIYKVNLTWKVL